MVTLLLDYQEAVRSLMAQIVKRTVPPPPPRDVRHDLASGSNGIRSGICLSLRQALGTDPKDSLPAAVSPELVHQTSLVSDDISDLNRTRNSHPALREKYGMKQAWNTGLALSVCVRISRTELTGGSIPEGCAIRIHEILD